MKVSALRASSSRSGALITSSLSHLYVRLMHFWSQTLERNRPISPSKRCRIPPHPTVTAYNFSPSPSSRPGLWFQSERSATGPASLLFRHRPKSKHINRTFVFHLTEDTFKKKMEISSLGSASLRCSSFNLVLFSCFYSSSSSHICRVVWGQRVEVCLWCYDAITSPLITSRASFRMHGSWALS